MSTRSCSFDICCVQWKLKWLIFSSEISIDNIVEIWQRAVHFVYIYMQGIWHVFLLFWLFFSTTSHKTFDWCAVVFLNYVFDNSSFSLFLKVFLKWNQEKVNESQLFRSAFCMKTFFVFSCNSESLIFAILSCPVYTTNNVHYHKCIPTTSHNKIFIIFGKIYHRNHEVMLKWPLVGYPTKYVSERLDISEH